MLNVRVKKALLAILTACLTVLMMVGAVLGFMPTPLTAKAEDTYTLVTDASTLAVGDKIVIVASDYNYALGSDNGNNRLAVSISKGNNTVNITDSVQVITLEAGKATGRFAFKVGSNYLYAAGSSKNYLKTKSSLDVNGSWKIDIADTGVATIKAPESNNRSWVRFNNGNSPKIFSCYSSGQADVSIYKMGSSCDHAKTKTVANNATTHKVVCADCGEVITASVTCTATSWSLLESNNDGTHTLTGSCVCGNTLTKPETCEIESASKPNNDGTHSDTGTCSVCDYEGSTIVKCTSNGTVVEINSNGDKTHDEITNCTECGGKIATTKDCTFVETDDTYSATYTCECGYSYTVNKYTVEFSVPDSVECETAVAYVLPGATVELPTTTAPEGYTFVGWTTEKTVSKKQPDLFTADKTVNGNMKLYALYKYEAPGTGCAQITDVNQLRVGMEVIIAADDGATAMSTNQKSSNRGATNFDPNNISAEVQLLTLQEGTTAGTYALYTGAGYLYAASSGSNHLKTQDENNVNGSWTITFDDKGFASIVATGSSNRNVMQFNPNNGSSLFACYASASQTALTLWGNTSDITYTSYVTPTIVSANLTIGETLTMNYKVAMNDSFADAEMTFTMAGNTTTVAGVPEGNVYVYSLQIAPQHMGEEITAVLTFNGETLASKESYSVKAYAEYQLANSNNETLKQLVADMLLYGAAAQVYTNYDVENLVADLANLGAAPTTTDFELVNELAEGSTYPAYFVGAGVRFGADNKIFVELSTVENVTLEVNGEEVELNGTTYYTEGLKATQFGDTFTFELYCDGVLMQTLTYSVNAYAYQFAGGDDAMANLAIALYNYGMSAENYVA